MSQMFWRDACAAILTQYRLSEKAIPQISVGSTKSYDGAKPTKIIFFLNLEA